MDSGLQEITESNIEEIFKYIKQQGINDTTTYKNSPRRPKIKYTFNKYRSYCIYNIKNTKTK